MEQHTLGRTGIKVSSLGLGGLFVSNFGAEFNKGQAAIHRALELGVNYIDTAPTYGNSEEVLGKALRDVSQPLVLSTKLGGRPQPFNPQDKVCLMQSVEESLRLLGRDYIDVLFVHEPDRPGQYDWWSDRENYRGPVLEVFDDLKQQGIVGAIGLGGTTVYEMASIMETGVFDVVLTAFNYSLLWREAELAVFPTARKHNMGVVVGSPLQQGALATRYDEQIKNGARWMSSPRRAQYLKLYELLDEIDISLPELGLRFALSNPDISTVLMGARSVEEVEQNVAAAERGPLPQELIQRLDEIAAMVPFRPYGEPSSLPFNWDYKGLGQLS
jgi:aryl-alcohol dehydrogenase-like predicted oxidoreductase